jgi:UDP-hydrolysing UDP-N-acetyl-D-glucosamine 2-epimerase
LKKKIFVVTERRADYSKFKPVLNEIKKFKNLEYFLVVTGSHLMKTHGMTINEIKNDDFKIFSTFKMYENNSDDSGAKMTNAFGRSIISLTDIIQQIKPDIILAGFDIGANFAAAIVGAHLNIIVAHMEGGDVTGTIDESIRHATSKFAHIHFTTNKKASERLRKMGEDPNFIFTVGNPSLDGIKNIKHISDKTLEDEFNIDLKNPFVIVLFHTVTSELKNLERNISEILDGIKQSGIATLIIHGNSDAGSEIIRKKIENSNFKYVDTIEFQKFINLLKRATLLIGNSSSGIMEAPFLGIPSINIGTRQNGRLRAKSVIDVNYNKNEIMKAISKIMTDKKFNIPIISQDTFYGVGNASKKIVKILDTLDLNSISIQKKLTY